MWVEVGRLDSDEEAESDASRRSGAGGSLVGDAADGAGTEQVVGADEIVQMPLRRDLEQSPFRPKAQMVEGIPCLPDLPGVGLHSQNHLAGGCFV